MATFLQTGNHIDFTPAVFVAAGSVVVQGELVGIADLDIPADRKGALAVAGVYLFTKAAGGGTAIPVGADVFYDVAEDVAKEDAEAGANKLIGKTILVTVDADTEVQVRLSQ